MRIASVRIIELEQITFSLLQFVKICQTSVLPICYFHYYDLQNDDHQCWQGRREMNTLHSSGETQTLTGLKDLKILRRSILPSKNLC